VSGREAVLAAVRAALSGQAEAAAETPAPYRVSAGADPAARNALFLQRLADYGVGVVEVAGPAEVAGAVRARMALRGIERLTAPADLDPAWRPEPGAVGIDNLDLRGLDAAKGALTACACAIAETGTIILDGGAGQGRRALTLLPDYHLCVVLADQLVDLVPEALRRLEPSVRAGRALTFLSGPSATADIEFERVVGVHGPRTLDVVFVAAPHSFS
jgi:L-lactate dehydrogenase complex protein LldG